jgi:hypothetical protein
MKFLLLLLCSFQTYAAFDLSTSVSGRSYPSLGGSVGLNLGYSVPLWGTPSKESPMFGLIRVNAKANSSIVVSGHDLNITIYPISFLGFGTGQKFMKSNYKDFSYYDCDKVRCDGELKKDYSFAKLAFGYGRLISYFEYKESRNSYTDDSNKKQAIAEYEDVVLASPINDYTSKQSYFLGLNFGDVQLGLASDNAKYHRSQQYYKMNLLIYRKKLNQFSYTIGVGGLETSHQSPGTVFVYKLNYEFLESMALF